MRTLAITSLALGAALALTGCVSNTATPDATSSATIAPIPTSTAVNESQAARDAVSKLVSDSIAKASKTGYTQVGTDGSFVEGATESRVLTTVYVAGAPAEACEATLDSSTGEAYLAFIDTSSDKNAAMGTFVALQNILAEKDSKVEAYGNGTYRMVGKDGVPLTVVPEKDLISLVITEYPDQGRWTDTFTYSVDAAGKKILADAVAALKQ